MTGLERAVREYISRYYCPLNEGIPQTQTERGMIAAGVSLVTGWLALIATNVQTAQPQHCKGCDGWKAASIHAPLRVTTPTPCPGLPAPPAILPGESERICAGLPLPVEARCPHCDEARLPFCQSCGGEWDVNVSICRRCAVLLDKPEDRLYHAQDGTWWRWERDRLVAADPPRLSEPPPVDVAGWLRAKARAWPPENPIGHHADIEELAEEWERTMGGSATLCPVCGDPWKRHHSGGEHPAEPAAPPEPPSRIWGYGCPEHRGHPHGMSDTRSMCIAKPSAGSKGAQYGSQICGRKLEPLRIGGDEYCERDAGREGGGDGS